LFDDKKGTNPVPWAKNSIFWEKMTDLDQRTLKWNDRIALYACLE